MSDIPSPRIERDPLPGLLRLSTSGDPATRLRALRALALEARRAYGQAVADALEGGQSAEAVGAILGVTRQNVRQTLARHRHPATGGYVAANRRAFLASVTT